MNIYKRKKGNEGFYYLKHSFRKNGKVITREKYLGKEIPANIEEIKRGFSEESERSLYNELEKIKNDFQDEWKRIPESVRNKHLEEISIAFTYNTNAIEGSTITLEETREIIHDKIAPNKPLRDIKETEAHSKVFLDMLSKKERISNEVLLKWHYSIFCESKPDIAGKYRDYLVRIADHLAPDWQDVKILMKKLFEFINENKEDKINPIILAARAHYKFVKIHPFGDGNGRIGRLIMNKILWDSGYPMVIIEKKKKSSYYKALRKDEDDFVKYFIRKYIAIHKRRMKG